MAELGLGKAQTSVSTDVALKERLPGHARSGHAVSTNTAQRGVGQVTELFGEDCGYSRRIKRKKWVAPEWRRHLNGGGSIARSGWHLNE